LQQSEIEEVAARFIDTLWGELGIPDAIIKCSRKEKPILVKNLDGNSSYWLILLACKNRVVGFLRLGLEGELLAYGRFGQSQELHDFPPLSYFSEEIARKEIHKTFDRLYDEISSPQLVHDGPVDRIAWLSKGRLMNEPKVLLFWTFGTSYSRPEGQEPRYGLL
jgi:hypothetical protein